MWGAVERGEGDDCSPSRQVKQRYLEVGRTMKDYEDRKYEQWKENTEQSLPHLMKKSLLTKVGPSTPPQRGREGDKVPWTTAATCTPGVARYSPSENKSRGRGDGSAGSMHTLGVSSQ